jgi:hypothetical protein
MTCAALRPRITQVGQTAEEREALEAALTTLVFSEPEHAAVGLGSILDAFERSPYELPVRLRETLYQLVDNSIVWIRLVGRPGQRRVVKLAYDIPLEPPVIPARRPIVRKVRLVVDLLIDPPEGRIDVRATLRRMRGRLTGRMGWDAIDLFLDEPVLQDPRSYHLEIAVPAGMRITELLLDRDDPNDPAQLSDGKRHLYVRFPRPRRSEQVRIKIRAERRGFLNASLGSSLVLAALLWMFAAHASAASRDPALAPSAAVLLVAPALMALFVSRPSESALVAAALTGVRTALAASATSSLIAAAAFAGARLTDHAYPTLVACAGVASAAVVSIGIAWLGTYDIVRKHCNRFRAFWCGRPGGRRPGALILSTIACGVLGVWAMLTFLNIIEPSGHSLLDDVVLIGGVLLPAAAIWIPRRRGAIPAGVTATGVTALFAALVLLADVISTHGVHDRPRFAGAVGTFIACGALALIAAVTGLGAELAPVESASAWARERRPIRFQLLDS